MAKTSKPAILVALEGFVTEAYGERINVTRGDAFEADHPAVKANPHLFGPLVLRHPIRDQKIEQATAAPGEKRG
jgi:hypothetical protein